MKKASVYIPIEVKARELTSYIFLSKFAISKGLRVYIGSKPAINRLLERKEKKAGVLIFKGGLDIDNILKIKKKINSFIILDQELSPSCTDFHYEMKKRYWPNSEKLVDRYYVIGQHAYDVGKEVFDEMAENIVKTGWPSIDMLRQNNRKIFDKRVNEIKKKYGDFILISSAFCFNSRKIIDDFSKLKKDDIWDSIRSTLKKELAWAELTLKEFEINIEILKKIDQDNSCPKIIIRPHPSEDHEEWKKISNSFKKIEVIFEGEITPWIYAANALLHRGCASAITAYMAGKPIGYPILKKEVIKKALPYDLSEHLFNAKDILEFCKRNINKKPLPPKEYSEKFKRYIHIEKKYASEIILEDLSKLNLAVEEPYKSNLRDKIFSFSFNLSKIIKEIFQSIFKLNKNISIAPQSQKMPGGIGENEIKDTFKSFYENKGIIIKKLYKDCVMIDNK